jgi:hypothetical protein
MNFDLTFLIAQSTEYVPGKVTGGQLAMAIAFPIFLGVALLGFGASREREGGAKWIKYLSLPILIFMAKYGWDFFDYANDPVAKELNLVAGTSKTVYNLAFIAPLGLAMAAVIFCVYWDKFKPADETY